MAMSKVRVSPVIRFSNFSKNWEESTLNDLAYDFEYGLNASAKEYDGENKYIRITDIDDTSRYFRQCSLTSPDINIDNSSKYILQNGDILFARTGASVGKSYLYKDSDGKVFYAGFLIRIKANDKSNAGFIFQNTFTNSYEKFVKVTSQRSGQPGINAKEYAKYRLYVPSLDEQSKIANFFNQVDKMISLRQHELTLLKQRKKAFLQKMFPKKGCLYPEIRLVEYGDVWRKEKFGDLGDTFTGLSGKTKEDFGHGEAEFITYKNVFNNYLAEETLTENVEIDQKQNQVMYGDILFTTSSETPEEVGMSSVWLYDKKNVYLNSFCFGFRLNKDLNPLFLAYYLRSPEVRKKFMVLAQGISRYNISKTKVLQMIVKIPNIDEQQKIGQFFKQLDDGIALHEQKLEKLKEMKKAFLQKMFV